MKSIEFKSASAQKLYDNYINRIARNLSILSEEDRLDLQMEINSHIYESMQEDIELEEVERLIDITGKLGEPEVFLAPMIAERKVAEAARTFNPRHVWQALKLNLSNGVMYSVLSLLYLLLSGFAFLIVAKLIAPENTGLFFQDQKFKAFGYISNSVGTHEILGFWFIPLSILSAVIFYFFITLIFRFLKKK